MDREELRKKYFGWKYINGKRVYIFTESHKLIEREYYSQRFPLSAKILNIVDKKGPPYSRTEKVAKKYGKWNKKDRDLIKSYQLIEKLELRAFEYYYWLYYRLIKMILKQVRYDKHEKIKEDLAQEANKELFKIHEIIISGNWDRKLKQAVEYHGGKITFKRGGPKKQTWQYYYVKKTRDKNTKKLIKEPIKQDPFSNISLIVEIIKAHINYYLRGYEKQDGGKYHNKQQYLKALEENEKYTDGKRYIFEQQEPIEKFRPKEKNGPYKFDYKEVDIPDYQRDTIREREPDLITPGPDYLDQDEIDSRDGYTREEFQYHYREANNYDTIGLESPSHSISEIAYTMRKFLNNNEAIEDKTIPIRRVPEGTLRKSKKEILKILENIGTTYGKLPQGNYNISQANICTKMDTDKMLASIKNPVKRKCFILYCVYILSAPKWRKRDNPGEDCPDSQREGPVSTKIIAKHFGITQRAVNKNINYVIKYLGKRFGVINDCKRKSKKLLKIGS